MEKVVTEKKTTIYQVGLNGAGHYELVVGERQSVCPHAGAFPMYVDQPASSLALPGDQQGQPETFLAGYSRLPCTTGCPLAELDRDTDGELVYTIYCGGQIRKIDVTEMSKKTDNATPTDQNEGAKLLTMEK